MNRTITTLGIAILVWTSCALGQEDTTWAKWSWLVGDWVGEGSGKPGEGTGRFSLHPDLDGRVLIRKGHAEYPASTDRPKIIHDDLMIVYPVAAGDPGKAVYFDNEGHVINYSVSYSGDAIILASEPTANAPVFRLTYARLHPDGVNIKFEMSRDGKSFVTYTQGDCRRAK